MSGAEDGDAGEPRGGGWSRGLGREKYQARRLRGELVVQFFFFSSRRRHTRLQGDWSSDVCSSDLPLPEADRRRVLVDVLPWLRGRVSRDATNMPGGALRQIATVEMRAEVLEFVSSRHAQRLAELGTSCPDHFLRTKIKPLYVDWDPQAEDTGALKNKLEAGLARYRGDYAQYYARHKRADSPAMRLSSPSVILIPGIGLVAWGKSKSEARVTAEFYAAAIGVMRGAERVSRYTALDRQEAFDIEYWLLEDAKLKRLPAERPLDRTVTVVAGAGSGIGRALLSELIGAGASVAADRLPSPHP